jgi:transcriptional regulator with XRE-family HTH domain
MNAKDSKTLAIPLVAADQLTDEQIAAQVGVTRQSLARWKRDATFLELVAEERTRQIAAIRAKGVAFKQNRIDAYNRRWQLLHDVIDERAEEMQDDAAGGKTGLLVRQVKSIGFGPNNHTVEEYAVDTGLLKEIRELEKQAAIEMGEWSEKRELTGDLPVTFTLKLAVDSADRD